MKRPYRQAVYRSAIIAAVAAPFALLCSAQAAQTGDKQADKPVTAGQKFKNVKVLKDLPADQLVPLMHQWNASLGVQCGFCHVVETTASGQHIGWEKDVKPEKAMARKMVLMTMKLNKTEKLLDNGATCYMCHHGHANPERKPPAEAQPPK